MFDDITEKLSEGVSAIASEGTGNVGRNQSRGKDTQGVLLFIGEAVGR